MEIEFTLMPYVGASPIFFGMSIDDVAHVLGKPDRVHTNYLGERDENRGLIGVRYSATDEKVVELGFVPGTKLLFDSSNLFECENLMNILMSHDSHPYELLGFIIFMDLGIAVGGYHDNDDSQKAITVFCKGRWDRYREEFNDFTLSEE